MSGMTRLTTRGFVKGEEKQYNFNSPCQDDVAAAGADWLLDDDKGTVDVRSTSIDD